MTETKRPALHRKAPLVAKATDREQKPVLPPVPDAAEIVTRLGMIITNNHDSAWLSDSDKKQTVDDCFFHIVRSLESCDEIGFHIIGTELRMNEHDTPVSGEPAQTFVEHLGEREIFDFSIKKGMPRQIFDELLDIFNATPEELETVGGFAKFVKGSDLTHIGARTILYQEISDDDMVITGQEMDKAGIDKSALSNVTNIVAFLKGDPGLSTAASEEATSGVQSASEDPVKLADLILRASEVRSGYADVAGGETLGDVVVGCMRRAYDELSKSAAMKTQKGKKNLSKTLMMLEREVLEGLRGKTGDDDREKYLAGISDAVQGMRDELQIEDLGDQYLKKQTAIEKSEESLIRYLRQKGVDSDETAQLGEKLLAEGLSMGSWQRLLVQSSESQRTPGGGPAAENPDVNESIAAIQQLAVLLEQMQKFVGPENQQSKEGATDNESELRKTMQEVDQNVDKVIAGTSRKIDNLVDELTEEATLVLKTEKDGDKFGPRMSRAKLLETLAEIVQEICQPLSVINLSVSMMMSDSFGGVSEAQTDILKMAEQSTDKIRKLVNSIMRISGVPTTLTPDREMLGALMQDGDD